MLANNIGNSKLMLICYYAHLTEILPREGGANLGDGKNRGGGEAYVRCCILHLLGGGKFLSDLPRS